MNIEQRSAIDRYIGSGHWFGFSIRFILLLVSISGAVGGYVAATIQSVSDSSATIFSRIDFRDYGVASLVFLTLAALVFSFRNQIVYYRIKDKVHLYQQKAAVLERNSTEFLRISQANANCDHRLFDIFVNYVGRSQSAAETRGEPMGAESVTMAIATAERNIEQLIESASVIFGNLTGRSCAVCIKIINFDESIYPDLKVDTYKRDVVSNGLRGFFENRWDSVKSNTADAFIFTEIDGEYQNRIYAEDDLESLAKAGKYRNNRPQWNEHYDATIVCGIESLRAGDRIPWVGLFCIDNKGGGLKNETAKMYIRQLAYRASVMLYRTQLLNEWRVLTQLMGVQSTSHRATDDR